jgi:DNA-binding XRE family transcriptional regulator
MEKQEPSEFARWVIQTRGELELTQDELAERAGVHVNSIKALENGVTQKPSTRVAAALRKALGNAPEPQEARDAMDRHTQAFLDLVGAYLVRLPAETRLARIFDLTRKILNEE